MKKIITSLAILVLITTSSFAEHSFGVRGSFGASIMQLTNSQKSELGNSASELMSSLTEAQSSWKVDNDTIINGGFSFWANHSFPSVPNLGIQTELGFLFNNGTEIQIEAKSAGYKLKATDKVTFTTMEIPVLLTYTARKGSFLEVIPQAGLYISFPIGKCSQDMDYTISGNGRYVKASDSEEDKIDSKALFGMLGGTDFAFNFSEKSAFMINLRYMFDFNKIKIDGDETARRTILLMSAGYRYKIN